MALSKRLEFSPESTVACAVFDALLHWVHQRKLPTWLPEEYAEGKTCPAGCLPRDCDTLTTQSDLMNRTLASSTSWLGTAVNLLMQCRTSLKYYLGIVLF